MKEYKVRDIFNSLYFIILISLLSGCENTITTDPREIHWDRDMCERCKMVMSDRRFAAQVINPQNGRVYKFDDIGCVPLWFKEDKIAWKDDAVIWVIDVDTNKWINAKTAFYDAMSITPNGIWLWRSLIKRGNYSWI